MKLNCIKSISLVLLFIVCSQSIFVTDSQAEYYIIDPEHSRVEFKVKHMGIGWVTGEFKTFEGKFSFDPKDLKKSFVEATIKTSSISTNAPNRDKHLKSVAFLNANLHKNIRFVSNSQEGDDPENFKIKGVLTIRDVSNEVILDVQHMGSLVDPWGTPRASFQASTKINRENYALTWNRLLESGALLVGEEVFINLDIQGVEVKDTTPKLIDPSTRKPIANSSVE